MIYVGTAGFTYPDWRGVFYPRGVAQRVWLEYYAERYSVVELNTTFHGIPKLDVVAGWVKRTPDNFTFAVKVNRALTHDREEGNFATDAAAFVAAVTPLAEAGKLAALVAQFPPSFQATPANAAYLRQLRDGLGELPAVIEFRHASWATDATFEQLRQLQLGYVCVDEPRLPGLMPRTVQRTGPVAYVRFHGRNAEHWRAAGWKRYDYDYSNNELAAWAPKLRALDAEAERTLAIFNNTPKGQALGDAQALRALLGDDAR